MKPTLIIISGFPATGKTTIAKKIAEKFQLPLITADDLKELMFDRISNWEDPKMFDSVSKASYDIMYHTVGKILSSGKSCMMEGFLLPKMAEPRIEKLKKELGCNLFQINFHCKSEVLIERYQKRAGTDERHPCHPENIPLDDFIKKNGKSDEVRIDGETYEADSTDFSKIDEEAIFEKVKEILDIK